MKKYQWLLENYLSSVRTQKRGAFVLTPFTPIEMTDINYLSYVTRLCHTLRATTDICLERIVFILLVRKSKNFSSAGKNDERNLNLSNAANPKKKKWKREKT